MLCKEIAENFQSAVIDGVIVPALGGIVVGQEVGRLLAVSGKQIRTMFTERKNGTMQFRRGFEINPNESILVCEDVITTGGSVGEVVDIVRNAEAKVVGVASIVDRSGGKVKFDVPSQFSVLRMDVVTYRPEECPLCMKKLPVDKPGSRGIS